jgi:hypothetical protein
MPGALAKPIDEYTGEEFYDLVKKLPYGGGHERERPCKNDRGCSGTKPSRHTRVLVDAVTSQDSLSAGTAPKFGVVYIRAVNNGDAPEARYGLLPDKNLEYYMIITADSADTMRWRLEQYDRKARSHSKFGSGRFVGCNHTWVAGARADFKSCSSADSVVKLGLALQGLPPDPIWASCATGCCISEGGP